MNKTRLYKKLTGLDLYTFLIKNKVIDNRFDFQYYYMTSRKNNKNISGIKQDLLDMVTIKQAVSIGLLSL